MKFQPGVSGNPKGRPALLRDFRSRCQTFMTKSGWATLESMVTDPDSPHRFQALQLICSYAYGKPTQPVSGDPDADAEPIQVTIKFDRPVESDA